MAKTLRTCELARPSWWCGHQWTHDPICILCDAHKPRETPLLVDVLAAALRWVWDRRYTDGDTSGQYPSGCERPGYTIRLTPAECDRVQAVLIRHKEEVGDDEAL